MEEILVSIVCTTFNHEKYIEKCVNGFLCQNTTFKYEIIIHDDASTDNTKNILTRLKEQYPEINVIFEKENQYSKGKKIHEIIYPYIHGKYVATCEGDDYWTDKDKLQKQLDFLARHPEYIACTHNTLRFDCRTGKKTVMYGNADRDLLLKDVIERGGIAYHTSSLVRKKEYYLLPERLTSNTFNDYPASMYLTLSGRVRYLADVMSVYRFFSIGSYSQRSIHNTIHQKAQVYDEIIRLLKEYNEFSNHEYQDLFNKNIRLNEAKRLYILGKYKEIIGNREYKIAYLSSGTLKNAIALYAKAYCPYFMSLLKHIGERINAR